MKRTYLFAILPVAAILLVIVLAAPQPATDEPQWDDEARASAPSTSGPAGSRSAPARDAGSPRVDRGTSNAGARGARADGAQDRDPAASVGPVEDPAYLDQLDRLIARTVESLYDGSMSGLDVLDRIRNESNPDVVDALFEALAQASDLGVEPEVLASWLELARNPAHGEKRWPAVQALGALVDEDGTIRRSLVELARNDGDEEVRYAAVGALVEHVDANPEAAQEVAGAALEMARAASDESFRAEALTAVDLYQVDRGAVTEVAHYLGDSSAEVRLVAAEVLGGARAEDRDDTIRLLERTYSSEADVDVRSTVLDSIVRVGRHRALEVLRGLRESDPDLAAMVADYVAVLETGEVDIERIHAAVENRIIARFESAENDDFASHGHDHDGHDHD